MSRLAVFVVHGTERDSEGLSLTLFMFSQLTGNSSDWRDSQQVIISAQVFQEYSEEGTDG